MSVSSRYTTLPALFRGACDEYTPDAPIPAGSHYQQIPLPAARAVHGYHDHATIHPPLAAKPPCTGNLAGGDVSCHCLCFNHLRVKSKIGSHLVKGEYIAHDQLAHAIPPNHSQPQIVMGSHTALPTIVLHIQVSYPPHVKIIAVYAPAPHEWEADWQTRKPYKQTAISATQSYSSSVSPAYRSIKGGGT